eukprot:gb/GFBE01009378.1/.p1 GENE.gb/GFBE01009378.1/~~gb/GFBE01009378.1/.p1  ORF type:complete len:246 (+),score=31.97 gb/GFBE01009378.1/:1-738(+)
MAISLEAALFFAPATRGRPLAPACLRTPSRTPSPMSMPSHFLPAAEVKGSSYAAEAVTPRNPQTPRSQVLLPGGAMPIPGVVHDGAGVRPQGPGSSKGSAAIPAARLVFSEQARGLSSLPRGWRTPDPSPVRDLPKCAALAERLVFMPPSIPDPAASAGDAGLACQPCAPRAWADIQDDDDDEEQVPQGAEHSRGTTGHPYTCGQACKYARKSRGCKDGANCDRCHLCEWKKGEAKRAARASNAP